MPFPAASGGTISSLAKSITQTAHGFAVGQWLYLNGASYALTHSGVGVSDTLVNSVGVVSAVTDANTFSLTSEGYVGGLSGLTAGSKHYISDTLGAISTAQQQNSKLALIADTATSGWVQLVKESNTVRRSMPNNPTNTAISTATVIDVAAFIDFNQTTAGVTLVFPSPTAPLMHRVITLEATSAMTTAVTLAPASGSAFTLSPGEIKQVGWNGSSWVVIGEAATTLAGDFAGVVRFSADTNTNLSTIASTNSSLSGTMLGTANRLALTSATVSGTLVVNAANGTIAIAKTGYYSVTVMLGLQSAGTTGQYAQLVKNGTTLLTSSPAYNQTTSAMMQVVLVYSGTFAAGDLIDVRINSTDTGTIGVLSYSYSVIQESGFLPVSGALVEYIAAVTSGSVSTNVTNGDHAKFNTVLAAGGVTLDTATAYASGSNVASIGRFTLKAANTYRLSGNLGDISYTTAVATNYVAFRWFNADANTALGPIAVVNSDYGANDGGGGAAGAIFTPSVDTRVELRIVAHSGLSSYGGGLASSTAYAEIIQIGSTATTTTARIVVTARNVTGQSIPNAVTTALTGWTEEKDTASAFNAATGIFTAPRAADYLVSLTIGYNGFTSTAPAAMSAEVTGAISKGAYFSVANGIAVDSISPTLTVIVPMTINQTLTMQSFQNTGAARTLNTGSNRTHLSIMEIEASY